MERVIFLVLVLSSSFCSAARHVFIAKEVSWLDAQDICRSQYTDLLPLTNDQEEQEFRVSADENQSGWVGLYWDTRVKKWRWSGGTDLVNQNFTEQQPNSSVAVVRRKELFWVMDSSYYSKGIFCLNLIVVQEEKTWEEALDHCRENHHDFTSLLSQTGNLLAQNQIQDSMITQRVWVGLRFLGDTWMWANGDRLVFQAWTQPDSPDQQCPVWKRCGALTKQGVWENQDCEERLHFICI